MIFSKWFLNFLCSTLCDTGASDLLYNIVALIRGDLMQVSPGIAKIKRVRDRVIGQPEFEIVIFQMCFPGQKLLATVMPSIRYSIGKNVLFIKRAFMISLRKIRMNRFYRD